MADSELATQMISDIKDMRHHLRVLDPLASADLVARKDRLDQGALSPADIVLVFKTSEGYRKSIASIVEAEGTPVQLAELLAVALDFGPRPVNRITLGPDDPSVIAAVGLILRERRAEGWLSKSVSAAQLEKEFFAPACWVIPGLIA